MRALPGLSVMGRTQSLSACQVTVALVATPVSSSSGRADVLAAPAAEFQLVFGTTPAVSPDPMGVALPAKSTLMAFALGFELDTISCVVVLCTSEPLVPVTVMVYVPTGVEPVVVIWSV